MVLKYGYESPEAFARAFQKMHGVTPTLAFSVFGVGKASGRVWNEFSRGITPVNAVMGYREEEAGRFPYMICASMPESGLVEKENYTVVDIPSLTWAEFKTEEHTEDQTVDQIQNLWKRIYTEWFQCRLTFFYIRKTCSTVLAAAK